MIMAEENLKLGPTIIVDGKIHQEPYLGQINLHLASVVHKYSWFRS